MVLGFVKIINVYKCAFKRVRKYIKFGKRKIVHVDETTKLLPFDINEWNEMQNN